MSAKEDFLFEIGTEELPPKSLRDLGDALGNGIIEGLKKAGIALDRKILSDLAISDAPGFSAICGQAKAALEA